MAEVTRVLREVQLDTEGGLVRARGSVPLRSKEAVLVNKEAAGSFTGEIGVNKAGLGSKEAAGCFSGEIGITKAELGNKDVARSFSSEIGITKALGNNVAADSFASEIDVIKAKVVQKKAAGTFIGGNDVTKAEVGNKEAAGPGVVTEQAWIEFVFLTKPPAWFERKPAQPMGSLITKETVPEAFINILKDRRPFTKLPPMSDPITDPIGYELDCEFPEARDTYLACMTRKNYCIDLHADVLRQHNQKGFAEVGVDFTDGVKKIFILPQH